MSREIELRGRHLLALAVLLALGGAGVYFLAGRGGEPGRDAAQPAGGARGGTPAEGAEPEMLPRTVFDDVGGERSQLQVTREHARGGGHEIDLGTFTTRTDAERVRAVASNAGIPTGVAAARDGSYRVVAGPFATPDEAARAAERLRAALGRPVQAVPPP